MQNKVAKSKTYNSTVRSRPFYRRPWFFVAIILLISLIAFCVWFFLIRPSSAPESTDPTPESNVSTTSVPDSPSAKGSTSTRESNTSNKEEKNPQTPAQYEGENPNTSEEITGFINYTAIDGDHLSIRLTLNQYLTSGTCTLKMSLGDLTIEQSAPIFADPSTSSCQGFDVPLSDLTASGTWQISVKVSADNKTGTIIGDYSL